MPFNLNSERDRGQGSFFQDLSLAIALLMPAVAGPLGALLQLLLPGVAACVMAGMERRRAMAVAAVVFMAAGGVMVLTGFAGAMLVLAQNVLVAVGIFLALERGRPGGAAWVKVSLAMVVLGLIYLLVGSGGDMVSAYQRILEVLGKDLDLGFEAFEESYLAAEGGPLPEGVRETYMEFKGLLLYYFPGIMTAMMALTVLANLWSFRICRLRAMSSDPHPDHRVEGPLVPFPAWRLPDWFVWLFIAAMGSALVPGEVLHGFVRAAGRNAMLFCSVFYLAQGFWILRYFFQRLGTPWWLRAIVYILIGVQWYGLLLVALTGLMDTWGDFRARLERAKSSRDGS